jgi:hypothetical protein
MSTLDDIDGLSLPPEVEGETISGVVTDFQGEPLVGVRVEAAETGGADLDLLPVLTDGLGRFEVYGLAEGSRYDLRFRLGTVKARTLAVPVGTSELRVKLARPQGILLLVKTEPGQPVPDVTYVVLHRAGPKGPIREHFGRTVRQRLLLWSIRPGTYTVTVWGGPYLPVEADGVVVQEGVPAPEVQVLLAARGGSIEGGVTSAGGPVSDALVAWRRLDAAGHAPRHMTTHRSAEDGTYAMRGLPQGRYRVSAWSEAHGVGEVEVGVDEDKTAHVDIALS